MSNSPLVSVIVPVYKVERYLPRCIESILRQTYTNFELILVDDGTPDRSGIICDRYAEKDSRIKVIHKENGGVSSARNAGIDAAQGEWITFIDSDDWVSDDYLEVLLKPLENQRYDIVIGKMAWISMRIDSQCADPMIITPREMNSRLVLDLVETMEFCGPCLKLFLKDKIEQSHLRFPEKIAHSEDTIFVNGYLKHCDSIYITGKIIYYYNRLNEGSITRRDPYFENKLDWDMQYIRSYVDMLDSFGVNEDFKAEVLSQKTIKCLRMNIKSIVEALNEEAAKSKIKHILPYYIEWITNDSAFITNAVNSNDNDSNIVYQLLKRNINAIYDYYKSLPHSSFAERIKQRVKSTISPFLEKYRDGLVKFKF